VTKGVSPGVSLFSGLSLYSYVHSQGRDVRTSGYLKTFPAYRAKCAINDVPFHSMSGAIGLGKIAVHDGKPFTRMPRARRSGIGCLSSSTASAIARVSQPAKLLGGIIAAQRFAADLTEARADTDITQKGLAIERDESAIFLEPAKCRWRQGSRLDGTRDQEHIAVKSGRSRSDGGISEVAAAVQGRAPETAEA